MRRQDILRTARRTAPTPRELHTVGERAPSSARSRTLTPNWRSLSPTSLAATNLGRVAAQRDLRASHRPRSTLPQRKTSESARSQAARYRSRPKASVFTRATVTNASDDFRYSGASLRSLPLAAQMQARRTTRSRLFLVVRSRSVGLGAADARFACG